MNSRQEFPKHEWLGNVVVSAKFKASNLVGTLTPGTHDNHWYAGGALGDGAADLEAIQARQQQIQQNQVGCERANLAQCLVAARYTFYVEAFIDKIIPNHSRDRRVIFHNENTAFHAAPSPP